MTPVDQDQEHERNVIRHAPREAEPGAAAPDLRRCKCRKTF
jgi:hypothetical protein